MGEFFFMNGYAPFIWPSYAIGIGMLVVLAVVSVRTMRARERELKSVSSESIILRPAMEKNYDA